MVNPLIAETTSSTESYSGVTLLESAHDLNAAINSGDWAAVALGAVGTALDALATVLDPFGAILAAGVGWLMEHIGPLKEALDALAGDPDEITAHSETWKNIATELGSIGSDLTGMVANDTVTWEGVSGDQYRARSADTVALLTAAQQASDGASGGIKTAGEVVAAVRSLVRDIIAELVGHLISWALQVVFTLGIGLLWVVPQVVTAVAKTAAQIADLTKRLVQALQALSPLLRKATDLFSDAGAALRKIRDGKPGTPATPEDLPGGQKITEVPKGGGPGGGTTPSSADSGPVSPPPKIDTSTGPSGSTTNTPSPDSGPAPRTPGPDSTNSPSGSTDGPNPNKPDNPRDTGVGVDDRVCKSDPVDIATGDVVMTQVDLTMPGERGDLVLSRTHVSSYRAGRWFGRSWASTLDQRLEADPEHICYFSEDGMILVFPHPAGEAAVFPVEGPRYVLRRAAGGYRLSAGTRELTFAAVRGAGKGVFPLTAIEQDGSRTAIEYTPTGAPSVVRRDDGRTIRITATDQRIVALGAPGAEPVVRFGYNRVGQLSHVADFEGRPLALDYDVNDRLVGWQDRTGTWYRYVYDAEGRCVRTVGADGFYNGGFSYDTEAGVTRHTDALGHIWTYRLNAARQVVAETDPLGNSRRYVWSRYDQLRYQVDELGRITRYSYADEVLDKVTRPDGSTVRMSHTPDGELVLEIGDGDTAVRAVLPAAAAPDPFTTTPGVSAGFVPAGTADPLTAEPAASAVARPGERDTFGRPQLVRTASGGEVRFGWTPGGQRTWRTAPNGSQESWTFDADGHVVAHRDAAGGVTRRAYGRFGLPVTDVDATGARTLYTYDRELRLTSVTNPQGLTWRYAYDPAGRLVEEVDFDGRGFTYAYDAAGQLVRMVNASGEVTEYTYDLLGNVVRRSTEDGVTEYDYDALGRLIRAANKDSALEIVRDQRGRVVAETVNGVGVLWHYAETAVRRTTSSGVDSEWRYDGAGRPVALHVAGREVRFDYDVAGREVSRSVDGALVLRQHFDTEDRLAEQVIAGAGQRTYGYRPDGSLAAVDDPAWPLRFGLDQAGRVTEVRTPAFRESFGYDLAGNIRSATTPVGDGPRVYQGNTLLSAGATSYTNDAQGRVTGRRRTGPAGEQVWTFTWDRLDRMTGVRTPDGARWTYLYDALGRRFAKQRWVTGEDGQPRLAGQTRFLWSGSDLVERIEQQPGGTMRVLTWERHPDDSRPVVQLERNAQSEPGRFHTVVTSPAGTPTELIDEHGALHWQGRTTLWGAPLQDAALMPLAFPGQHRDEESGLHYNVYRYYDPETARYLSQDPLGLVPAPNPVGYVSQPLLAADPLGLTGTCGANGSPKPPDRPNAGNDAAKLDDFKQPDGSVDLTNMSDADYAKFKPLWNELMRSDTDKQWFWSGGHRVDDPNLDMKSQYQGPVMGEANKVAKDSGGNTLESLIEDHKLKMPSWGAPNAAEIWTDASTALARNAKGETHVMFPGTPGPTSGWPGQGDTIPSRRPDNVFDMDEFPILRHNPNVSKIWAHDADTGAVDLLWQKGD
ncbi:RHS repeat-associated core domain-containing protein [Amycolatopsis marina]|uniref:RHS repeat-associated core domain-containing protein n=1 Tax=Amycolatopsis marina TaxID=490629 RepID=A0A1I1CF87_9PSEU|nr:DUF6531 domain-containing protein [Amycolatopsis marina]SFB61309.1 RHS repeat-associated core domain-containing protein [Amycolatopsis marina]